MQREADYSRSLTYLRTTALDAAATCQLADALSYLYQALRRLGLVTPPQRPYGSEALRFALRTGPFAPRNVPELPSFDAFRDAVEQGGLGTGTLLDEAEAAVAAAKKAFEALASLGGRDAFATHSHHRWLAATRNSQRSAILAGIAISTVRRAMMRAGLLGSNGEEPGVGGVAVAATDLKLKVEVPGPEDGYHEWWIVPKIIETGP